MGNDSRHHLHKHLLERECEKSEVMRTLEHKISFKNGANSNSVKTGSEMRDNSKWTSEYQDIA